MIPDRRDENVNARDVAKPASDAICAPHYELLRGGAASAVRRGSLVPSPAAAARTPLVNRASVGYRQGHVRRFRRSSGLGNRLPRKRGAAAATLSAAP